MSVFVECVPNISEGRDKKIIDTVVSAIRSVPGVSVLDVDPGADTNRTVITMVGSPEAVMEGAFQCIKAAAENIDMRRQKGAHPRMGATDVCPFIPLSGCTMKDCVEYAEKVAERVGNELFVPVYLYEEAARVPQRRNLADIRAGEYEGLEEKMKRPDFKPDYGPHSFNAKAGATVMGAREFLIAYNINLNTSDKKIAHEIALNMREKGRVARDANGKMIKKDGEKVYEKLETSLDCVKSIGWSIETEKYGMLAQISVNLTNYKITPFYKVLETARQLAAESGAVVTGSELVGLIPKQALLDAGMYYLEKLGVSRGMAERDVLKAAVQSMGLADLGAFDLDKKVIEYCVEAPGKLASMTIRQFADEVASDSPAPGGGSVAAQAGAISAALSAMVGNLTYGKKDYASVKPIMEEAAVKAQRMKEEFLRAIDRDTDAFNLVMDAMKLPKGTDEEKKIRGEAIENANKEAALVPFSVLELCLPAASCALEVVKQGNKNSITDAGVAGLMIRAAAYGAAYNVIINLQSVEDKDFTGNLHCKSLGILKQIDDIADEIHNVTAQQINLEGK